jgi:SAM-dependent methyltransferase
MNAVAAHAFFPADAPPALDVAPGAASVGADGRISLDVAIDVGGLVAFEPVLRAFVRRPNDHRHLAGRDTHQDGLLLPWLPHGRWTFRVEGCAPFEPGRYEFGVSAGNVEGPYAERVVTIAIGHAAAGAEPSLHFAASPETRERLAALSWSGGLDDWFNRHFCHAAKTIAEQFLRDAPQLRGRILDIGAGDGITDLGIFLRYQPIELVGVDIVDYMHKLPDVASRAGLPLAALPQGLRLHRGSCESMPFADEHFDLVLSWGSVEHVKGGYRRTLDEVFRVLKPGGLFFVNPGLYYSAYGSHLGEFSAEPHLHLRIAEDALRDIVMSTEPRRMDRSGFDAPREEYWRFYRELNRIRVAEFERELRSYGYEFVRAALRTSDIVEYDAALQPYSLVDLAVEDAFYTLRKPSR